MHELPPWLRPTYFLDESDPDVLVLRRSDGSFVAAFSAPRERPEKASSRPHRRTGENATLSSLSPVRPPRAAPLGRKQTPRGSTGGMGGVLRDGAAAAGG